LRKIVIQEAVSLDGFMAGPKGEFDWPLADEEFEQHANLLLENADTFLLGRMTYEWFAQYWPTALTSQTGVAGDPTGPQFVVPTTVSNTHDEVARKMNSYRKVVFSKTLSNATWNNSTIIKEVRPDEIKKLKEEPGKDMVLLGSASLASTFVRLDLIDEYRLWINPIILGGGKPLFGPLPGRRRLELADTKRFSSGLISLTYRKH
jgi:dihydrofolate reductase